MRRVLKFDSMYRYIGILEPLFIVFVNCNEQIPDFLQSLVYTYFCVQYSSLAPCPPKHTILCVCIDHIFSPYKLFWLEIQYFIFYMLKMKMRQTWVNFDMISVTFGIKRDIFCSNRKYKYLVFNCSSSNDEKVERLIQVPRYKS